MKKQSENAFAPLSTKQLESLTGQVKETLAFEKPRNLSAAELWDIQRRGRAMVKRRNFFA
jgi:hypothetical protein